MLQTREHCRKVGKEREGRRRKERRRRERKEGGKKGNRRRRKRTRVIKEGKWKEKLVSSHDVHFAVLIVPAIGRKVAWFAEGHLPLGHFDELIRTSWSVCTGEGERGREERGERRGDVAVNNCSLTQSAN